MTNMMVASSHVHVRMFADSLCESIFYRSESFLVSFLVLSLSIEARKSFSRLSFTLSNTGAVFEPV